MSEHRQTEVTQLAQSEILTAVAESLAAYLERGDWNEAMGRLLRCALSQTQSEYGFVGVVVGTTLRVLAHEGIVWDKVINREFYEQALRDYEELGYLEFTSFNNLFGRAITSGRAVIANEPDRDPRSSGRPTGHPPMHSFLGVPIFVGRDVYGVVALANRPGGYSVTEQRSIETLVQQVGGLCASYRQHQAALILQEERERAKRAQSESEERLRLAVEASNVGLWDWDLASNEVTYSREWKSQLGYADHEIGKHLNEWDSRLHPDDLEPTLQGVQRSLTHPEQTHRAEFRMRHKDGSWRWIYSQGKVFCHADGTPRRMVGCHVDFTERKQSEEALRQSFERFRQLAETIQDVFWITDATGERVLYVSPAYETIFQRSCESLYDEPRTWLDAIHADDRQRMQRDFAARLSGTFDEEYRIVRGNNEVRWIRDRAFPVRNAAGQIDRVVGVARDITERHTLQQQLAQSQKMQAIGTLAGGIAHDFNNTLAAIVGNANLAKLDLAPSHPSLTSINEIIRAGQRAKDLVQRLLTFSRPREHILAAIDLSPVVEEAITLLRSTIPAGIELRFNHPDDLPTVRADASQIHQVTLNLVTNAWHAIDNQSGRIEIGLEACVVDSALSKSLPDLQPGPHVRLSVRDTGKGIDAATLQRIFEPFFTTKASGQGAGLGLSVVHGIVHSHGGAISVQSRPGEGSTFHLYFPASAQEAAAPIAKKPVDTPLRGNGEHILYLDDEEPLVYLAVRFLERFGYRVSGFTVAADALAAFEKSPTDFDLIITDYNMPHMSGLEVAQRLMSIRSDAPVVLTSGYARPAEVEQARALGIREILLKPNTIEEFGPIVHRLLSSRVRPHG